MIVFEDVGIPLTHQKIVPGNTITSISAYCYQYWKHRLDFDDGDYEIKVGDWIVGATSGGEAKVLEVSHDSSAAWTNDFGYLIVDSWNGTAFQDNEELKVAAGATMANANGIIKPVASNYPYKGLMAKSALVIVYAQTALVGITGGKPDQTALIGTPMVANSSILLRNIEAIKNFKCVDYTAASASTVQIDFFF
jgi:hypothetical protein